ncbi:MocR-like pyridoxine biosynthesis transcription factor PdxR [Cohaesibacter celericrescens]|uniref:MocR-like pyridoxine biosynthesis transcription factor PdxR n=1 Tax=Cohaesibacter celericrescens TaxID=2067669 RepID=UPI003567A2BB
MLAGHIMLDRSSDDGLVRQLFGQIRQLIERGDLVAGFTLPSSRQLALALGVGRNTVVMAYEQLELEGYLQSDGRRGTCVSEASRGFLGGAPDARDDVARVRTASAPRLSRQALQLMSVERRSLPTPSTFQPGLPDVRSFPHNLWGRMLRRAARHLPLHPDMAGYAHYSGLPALKQAILAHAAASRGVIAEVDQVMILSSAQAALDLVARLLLNPGDMALHEEPGYGGMTAALKGAEALCHPIAVHQQNSFSQLRDRLPEGADPRLIYTTPSHQFPSGQVMALQDRLALLSQADALGAFILEDDYDSEFHFSGAPISCLQGLDRRDVVIYMGTFSKSLMPSLHVAYLIVPKRLVAATQLSLRNVGAVPSVVVQQALADFMADGHLRAHVREMNKLYHARRDALVAGLNRHCRPFLAPVVPDGGIQLPAYFTEHALGRGFDDKALVPLLRKDGVESSALSSLYWSSQSKGSSKVKQGLFLGYAASNLEEIEAGVKRIATRLDAMAS